MAEVGLRQRVEGCVVGGAVGDALGAPHEGLWSRSIPAKDELLAGYGEFEGYPRGQYTDDTQLTVATIESIVRLGRVDPGDVARSIAALFEARAVIGPGGACRLAASRFLEHGDWSRSGAPAGEAGNGTAMRTAALGLFFLRALDELPGAVADVSRITHTDSRSVAGGVAVAKACQLLASAGSEVIDPAAFCRAVSEVVAPAHEELADLIRGLRPHVSGDRDSALAYVAWSGMRSPEFEEPIVTPYVVPTVLAAFWAVLRNPASWGDAVAEAVGLGGDVDTLGAIVGALMGAKLGIDAVPSHLADSVVDAARLRRLSARYSAVIEAGRR